MYSFTTLLAITRLLDFWGHYPNLPYPKLKNHHPSGPDCDKFLQKFCNQCAKEKCHNFCNFVFKFSATNVQKSSVTICVLCIFATRLQNKLQFWRRKNKDSSLQQLVQRHLKYKRKCICFKPDKGLPDIPVILDRNIANPIQMHTKSKRWISWSIYNISCKHILIRRMPTASLKTSLRTLVPTVGETLAANLTRAAKNFFVLSINVSGFDAAGPLNSLQHNLIPLFSLMNDFHRHPSISFSGGLWYLHYYRGLTQGLWRFLERGWRVEPSVLGGRRRRVMVRRWSRRPRTKLPLHPTPHPPPSPPWWTSARSSSRPWNWKYKQHVAALRFKKDKVASTFEFAERI